MDPRDLDHRVTAAQSCEAHPQPSDSKWIDMVLLLARLASTQSVTSLDPYDINEGSRGVHTLHDHVGCIALTRSPLWEGIYNIFRHSLTLASPMYVDIAHTSSSPSRNRLKTAEVSTKIFVENLKYKNKMLSTLHSHDRMQPKTLEVTRHERSEAQMAFISDHVRHTITLPVVRQG